MTDERTDGLARLARDGYNPPPPTPREDMWAAIQGGLEPRRAGVVSLEAERARRTGGARRLPAWVAAAAAVLVLGVGIGRLTAPTTLADLPGEGRPGAAALRLAAVDHLARSESLLRLVRADARTGQVDPAVGSWAGGLLTQTRLLLDAEQGGDPAMRDLLEDLELVLVQIVGVARARGADGERARSEMNLAMQALEQNNVLPRIQAVVPLGSGLAGT